MSGSAVIKRRERERLFKEQRGLCFYCNRPMLLRHSSHPPGVAHHLPPELATLDHIIPRANGGAWSPRENAVAACLECNAERGTKDARLFMLKKQGALT